MKKLFGILGSLAFATSAAQAQSTVAISGLFDAYVGSMRNAGDVSRTKVENSGGMSTSYFGFSGTEDLGGGLKAFFNLNAFFTGDNGGIGRFNGDPFFARDSNVGLSGGFGSVTLGRAKSPNFLPSVFVNPMGDSFTFSPLILHENISTNSWGYITTPSDTGWANSITYSTPTIGGFSANLQYQLGEQANADSRKNIGANIFYMAGPLTLVAFYERDQINNPFPSLINANVGSTTVPDTRKDWMVGGSYDAGFLKGFASFGKATSDVTDFSAKTSQLGISVPVGVAFVLADVARTKVTGTYSGTRTTATLGYDYFLSKRTDLYAMAMRDQITDLTSHNSVALGIRHRF